MLAQHTSYSYGPEVGYKAPGYSKGRIACSPAGAGLQANFAKALKIA